VSVYRTIVADPPWPMKWTGGGPYRVNGRGEKHVNRRYGQKELDYPTMSIEDICALNVSDLAEKDAHLYVWIPDAFLINGDGQRVVEAWGFTPGRLLIWAKTGFGMGRFPRPQHEAVIVCRRGKQPFAIANAGSVQTWKVPYWGGNRVHSRKPDGFLDLVERASPGPYLEMFARRQRLGWDTWGDQALQHVEIA
jgi:N6-adenosine-specific RNA methylase IME4